MFCCLLVVGSPKCWLQVPALVWGWLWCCSACSRLQAAVGPVLLILNIFCLCLVNNKVSAFCGIKHELYCPVLSARNLRLHLSRFVVLEERNGFLSGLMIFAGSVLHSDTLPNTCKSCFPYELSSGLCNVSMNFLMQCLNRREQRAWVRKRERSAARLCKLGLGAVLHADC